MQAELAKNLELQEATGKSLKQVLDELELVKREQALHRAMPPPMMYPPPHMMYHPMMMPPQTPGGEKNAPAQMPQFANPYMMPHPMMMMPPQFPQQKPEQNLFERLAVSSKVVEDDLQNNQLDEHHPEVHQEQ